MTARLIDRPARTVPPPEPGEPIDISPPPVLPEGKAAAGVQGILLLAGAAAAMTLMFLPGSGFAVSGAVVMLVSVSAAAVFHLTQRGRATRTRRQQRAHCLDHLDKLRDDLRDWEQGARDRAGLSAPPPGQLLDIVTDPARLWERRRHDPDFLSIRIGVGARPVREMRLRVEGTPTNPPDPSMLAEARALQRRFSTIAGMPLQVDLDRAGDVALIGASRQDVLGATRTILAQIAATHAPDDVTVAVITPHDQDWAWTRWLPHVLNHAPVGASGPQPLIFQDAESLAALLAEDLADRSRRAAQSYPHGWEATAASRRLLVIDDAHGRPARQLPTRDKAAGPASLGVTVLHLLSDRPHEPDDLSSRVTVGEQVAIEDLHRRTTLIGTPEMTSAAWAEGLAREIAPLRLSADSSDEGLSQPRADFPSLLNLDDPSTLDVRQMWAPRGERDFLRVPIGVTTQGTPTLLDLKGPMQHGMGPHGLCVGATGSGKSELLRTIVLALASTHPPDDLSMVLAGPAFAPFKNLPHVSGLITDLEADSLIERFYTNLNGEVLRRQQLLADAGQATDITAYTKRRRSLGKPPTMPPLRHLVVVIDEFDGLLTAKPEFIELFLHIGRIGGLLGVHLLLSSKRIERGRLRGLETYLSYRLGLRMQSDMDSRIVLHSPDAFHLPPRPGTGYLKVDSAYEQFQAACVSGPVTEEEVADHEPQVRPMPRFAEEVKAAEETPTTHRTTGPTLLGTIVGQLNAAAEPVPPLWREPLPDAVSLDVACGGFDMTAEGLRLRGARNVLGLVVPLGTLDDPAKQRHGTWLVDLSAGGGNLMILGGPGSGKTTALRTLTLGLASTHRPTDVGVYGLDLLGSGLRALEELPHVGGIATRDDGERIRRTVDEVHGMLTDRERLFQQHQLDGVGDLRAARATGRLDDVACTEVVLLIDDYGQIYREFRNLEAQIHDLLARGGRYGIHVVATGRRYHDVPGAQQVSFSNRIELKLAESAESAIDSTLARTIRNDQPGRALTGEKLFAQVALPRLSVTDPRGRELGEAAKLVRGGWNGPVPPPVRVLPAVLGAGELDESPKPGIVPFGQFESDFAPAVLDLFGLDQHLLALGDRGTGKTNLLRLLATRLIQQYSAEELVFAVFDPRHALGDAIPEDYLGGYANNHTLANQLAMAVAQELARRNPSAPTGTNEAPKVVLLADDYDILAASGSQPLAPFVPYLGRDLGLHVVMTRRVMGAARGLNEPFTRGVREAGCLGLLMSGDRREGQLFPGVVPSTLPTGRGLYVRPGETARTVQTAFYDPRALDAE